MELQDILSQLKDKFGDSFDISKVTDALKSVDLKNLSLSDIESKLGSQGLLEKVNVEGVVDEIKSKAGDLLGGVFGK